MSVNFEAAHRLLQTFNFNKLFIEEFGWQQPKSDRTETFEVEETRFERKRIAQMSEVPVFEIVAENGEIPKADLRSAVYKEISESFAENLLIFINSDRTRSLWFWAKREGAKFYPRTDTFIKEQPPDLLLSKLGGLAIAPEDLGPEGELPVIEVADRLQKSLDVDKVTKKFYQAFQLEHQEFLGYVRGIDNENDRRWYTSVILNRLMFVYFLQKKGFINRGNTKYLRQKLTESQQRGPDRFYSEFLETLFFEGLAKPERDRSPEATTMLGQVCYLNGGLFLKHAIELNQCYSIQIPDQAFDRVFTLFDGYSWHLDDRPGGKPDEINPDVLGYIFEKYINQKAFGAYYTRPEITEYLCDRTINKLILDRVNEVVAQQNRQPHEIQAFDSIDDMVMHMDVQICRHLVLGEDAILRNLSLLDPACGSGAFLIAAMKTLINIYSKVVGVAATSTDRPLRDWLAEVQRDHPSLPYFIKKRVITDNLYGVDIMEEAVEIAKLRLFLALVSSAIKVDELEPLPNIDFNIMAGNSLIGLVRVDEESFDTVGQSEFEQGNLLQLEAANSYRQILEEKNRSIAQYKQRSFNSSDLEGTSQGDHLQWLRDHINDVNEESEKKLNQILLNEFTRRLSIKFEQITQDGNSIKRDLNIEDIKRLRPFHWGYYFDQILDKKGGFDAILTNPPWEVLQTNEKEFFQQYSPSIQKKKLRIEDWEKQREELLKDEDILNDWLEYSSQFPHQWLYFKKTQQYKYQISKSRGKTVGSKPNLYSLFAEQCYNLLCKKGECGFVISSGIYSDLGTKRLRRLFFESTEIGSLIGLENQEGIFEEIDSRYKFAVMTFKKGGFTHKLRATFMRQDLNCLESFPDEKSITLTLKQIEAFSPDSLTIREFRDKSELKLSLKLFAHPFLSDQEEGWGIDLYGEELNMSRSAGYFRNSQTDFPVYEGGMIWQFNSNYSEPRYWVSENELRADFLKKRIKRIKKEIKSAKADVSPFNCPENMKNDYEVYRLAIRKIARSRDTRTLISTIIPPFSFAGNSLSVNFPFYHNREQYNELRISNQQLVSLVALLNSFVVDHVLRSRVNTNLNLFHLYELPLPKLDETLPIFKEIVGRAAKLICTSPDYDDLATEVGLGSHCNGVIEEIERDQLRAELDGIIAHLYGLTEAEFTHILSTFPLVPEETKQAALEEYRKFAPLAGDQEIIDLINQGESAKLEFKSTARWDLKENKKSNVIEEVILKTVAAFLNTDGGTLLIGVVDDGSIVGLQPDFQTLKKKDRDGYELWLLSDLLLKGVGKDLTPYISIGFGLVDNKDVCRVTVQPAPRAVYVDIKNSKSGQLEEYFFIRTGNSTNKLTKPSEINNYIQTHWS
jgi:hypothetical protein